MLPICGARQRACVVPLACCALAACGSGDGFHRQRRRGRPAGAELRLDPSEHLRAALRALPLGRERAGRLAARRRQQLRCARRRRRAASARASCASRRAIANNSYLIQKLEGTAGVGERMPAGLPAVPQADINIIRQWIADGAQPSSSASGPDPSHVVVAGAERRRCSRCRPRSRPASTASSTRRPSRRRRSRCSAAGPMAAFGTADDVAITPASVTVPDREPALGGHGSRRACRPCSTAIASRLVGTGPAAILDLSGNALDGEPVQLPSGDGTAGGDYTATFTVAGALPTLRRSKRTSSHRAARVATRASVRPSRRHELDERERELRGARWRRERPSCSAATRHGG